MANTNAPFGFRHYGGNGSLPTYEQFTMRIAPTNSTPIFFGDAVTTLPSGYIGQAPNDVTICGVFCGCTYMSVSQKRRVWMNYWPGSDANGDIAAYVINDVNAIFIAQSAPSSGTPTPVSIADIGNNIALNYGTIPNPATGISVSYADTAQIGTASTRPFRIVGLANVTPGQVSPLASANGNDHTSPYNHVLVMFNNFAGKVLAGI